jgi:hypothetical protein
MKKNTFAFLLGLLFISVFKSEGQSSPTKAKIFGREIQTNSTNGFIRCASTEYELSLREKYPKRLNTEEFERWIAPKIEAVKSKMAAKRGTNETNTVITIPVVVHVIHNGDAVGSNENISDARILSQIAVLNQDFRRMVDTPGFNSTTVGADVEIEFCLAKRKPDGTATDGINRINLGVESWATESSIEENLKPVTQWDPTQYLNLWVAQFTTDEDEELNGILGYAQFPSDSGLSGTPANGGDSVTDGVIIDWRCFGTSVMAPGEYFAIYDRGRTTTHEVGHFLGLRHIWGDNNLCQVNNSDSFKDYCPDTPAAAQAHYICLVNDSCPSNPGNDMIENYMDYTNDACMNIFTSDQKNRMLTVMQNSTRRKSLVTSKACAMPLDTNDFKIYPNPNNGNFTIEFNSNSGSDITIDVYDISGRRIFTQSYPKKKLFSENLQLNNLQSGVYLVNVEDGNRTEVRKIIVN